MEQNIKYPMSYVYWFFAGLVAAVFGLIVGGIALLLTHSPVGELIGSLIFTFGSISVAVSLMMGENYKEKTK